MKPVACAYCGLPVRVARVEPGRPVFCCTGCAIASTVPVDEQGGYPITAGLVFATALAFVLFNQWLMSLLAVALRFDERPAQAGIAFIVSLGVGVLAWLALVVAGARARTAHALDLWLAGAALVAGAAGFLLESALGFALANTALAAWHARGFLRRKLGPGKTGIGV